MKTFKKLFAFLFVAMAVFALVGCKKNNPDTPTPDPDPIVTPAITLPENLKVTVNVEVGDEVDLNATVTENFSLVFESSASDVVKIEGNKAKALKAGEATITISVKDHPEVKVTVKVVVKEKGEGPHTHEFGAWTVTTPATCLAEGEEKRTCACGEFETRKIEKADHTYQVVNLVPATADKNGVEEHYECSVCHKIFDANKKETSLDKLSYEGPIGVYVDSPLLGTLNSYSDIQIYDGSTDIDKGDIDGYLFGIDASGKIIYASYYGNGYGGPSDGFYHDGSYQLTPGQVCGIFDVDAAFLPWPATTVYNGEEVNAWTLYKLVAPQGGFLICIRRGVANDFIQALTGDKAFIDEIDNTLFEVTMEDGRFNDVKVDVKKGIKNACFTAYYPPALVVGLNTATGLRVYDDNSQVTKADLDDNYIIAIKDGVIIYASHFGGDGYGGPSDGFYHDGSYVLTNGMVCGIFDVNEQFAPWPAKVTIDGVEVNAWTLYEIVVPEGGFIIAGKHADIQNFIIKYFGASDFASETANDFFEGTKDGAFNESLEIVITEFASSAAITVNNYQTGLTYGGTNSGSFELQDDGTYSARITLAQWNYVTFALHGAKGAITEIWYDNTTFEGHVTDAEKIGADWTYRLYHEDTKRLYNCLARELTYEINYDPYNNKLTVYCEPFGDFDLEITGDVQADFILNEEGWYEATVILNKGQEIQINGVDEYAQNFVVWYDNTYVYGAVTGYDAFESDGTINLYHVKDAEGNEIKKFINGFEDSVVYKFAYKDESLSISVIYKEYYGYTGTINGQDVDVKVESTSGTLVTNLAIWDKITFYKFNSDGTLTYLWYDNATLTGDVTASDVYGADWTNKLYHEGSAQYLYCCSKENPTYKFTYNFVAKTLDVKVLNEPVLTISGDYSEIVTGTDGVFEAAFTLQVWNKVSFTYTDAEGNATTLWYDNTTFSGYVTSADANGADWTENLYHEGDAKELYCCVSGGTLYTISYNPSDNRLKVDVIFDEYVSFTTGSGETGKLEMDEDYVFRGQVTLPNWGNVTLEFSDYTNTKKTIWFDNTTITGSVTAESVIGCDWTANLYHEEGAKKFYAYNANTYYFEYDSYEDTLKVTVLVEPVFKLAGDANVEATASTDGKFYAEFALKVWQRFSMTYTDKFGEETTIWYDNTTFRGEVRGATDDGCDWTTKLYHEGQDKILLCSYDKGAKYQLCYDPVQNTLVVTLLKDESVAAMGSLNGLFAYADGKFVAKGELPQWGNVTFVYSDKYGNATTIWYDTATITGKVTAADAEGADWTENLYHEGTNKAFYCCVSSNPTYVFTFDPLTMTLDISIEHLESLSLNGQSFVANAQGLFVGEITLGQWGSVEVKFSDKDGVETVLWYDNTTISGLVTDAQTSGADWTEKLYHEGEDKKFYCCVASNPLYQFTYDPTNNTMKIALKPTYKYSGSVSGEFVETGDGVYQAIITLAQWSNVQFIIDNGDGTTTEIWYDNTAISGLVTDVNTEGADWTEKLYHEGTDKKFYCCVASCTYKLIYDSINKTLEIKQYSEPTLVYSGSNSGSFVKTENGYEAVVSFSQWNNIQFVLTDDEGLETVLWYDNTTFTGIVTDANTSGADWTENLYHEGDEKKLYCCVASHTYKFVYDPVAKTLTISTYVPENTNTGSGDYFVLGGTEKVEINQGVKIFDSTSQDIVLDEYTLAFDATGKLVFGSRTSSGYGGPGDGFYHDGSYQAVAGQVCCIFSLDSQFAPWPAKATVDGVEVNAWTLYTVVCPENWHIVTGSQAALENIVKALTGVQSFNETNNALFENTLEKGSITTLVTFEFND